MADGPVTEGVKVAGTFMEAMKSQPLALALVVCNLVLLWLFFYFLGKVYERREADQALLYSQNDKVQQLLLSCIPASELVKQNADIVNRNLELTRGNVERSLRADQELQQIIDLLRKPVEERK